MDATNSMQHNIIALAQLQVEVTYLKAAVGRLDIINKEQSEKLDRVLTQLSEARGGWRALMLMGGAAGTVGSCLTWLLSHMRT